MAASAYTGISLTHRDLASSVAYVTATESPEKDASAHDWTKLSTATQTLVFFMGLRRLDSLAQRLIEHGRAPTTPAAVVSSASLPSQRTVVGTLADIADKAAQAGLDMPALTIVGDVVSLRERLRWFDQQPLFGKRVLITRPAGQSEELARALRDAGAQPLELPSIEIAETREPDVLRARVIALPTYDWVVFTSANGVRAVFDVVAGLGKDSRLLGSTHIAAIGPKTAAALLSHGLRADVVPEEFRGEQVAEAMAASGPLAGKRVLLARAEVAREALPERLRELGCHLDVVSAYRTVRADEARFQAIRAQLEEGGVDVVTFTSSSTAEHLVQGLGADAQRLLAQPKRAAIGPITAETLARLGFPAHVVAEEYTGVGLLRALVRSERIAPTDGVREKVGAPAPRN
jgi:uroporphyrinogen III methyltransferase/synthase